MSFTPSEDPDITEGLPTVISARAMSRTFEQSGQGADIAIGNLPFRLAVSDNEQGQRETAPIRKQQLDTSAEPGEQSLEQGYWLRSQTSWHRGSGIAFYEPGTEEETEFRYAESVGIDPWTRGEVTLLKKMAAAASTSTGTWNVSTAVVGGENRVVVTHSDQLFTIKPDGTSTSAVTIAAGATRAAVFGGTAWVGYLGGVKSVDLATGTTTDRYTGTGNTPLVHWAKSRLFATVGPALYELDPNEAPAGALPTALFTHPLSDWTWTGVAEAPGAVLVSGYAAGTGAIYKLILEDDGTTTPRLGPPIQVAEFPPGEEVHSIRVYLGAYIGIGTSKGLRVGLVDATGSVQYGPLTVETTSPVVDLAARDSFIYGAVQNDIDGKSGAVRVSLADEVSPMRFAWAWDAQTHVTGDVNSLAFLGTSDRLAIGIEDDNVYLQSATLYEDTGRLVSGAIRYATGEPKAFHLARTRISFDDVSDGGSVLLSTRNRAGSDSSVITYTTTVNPDEDVALNIAEPAEYISLRLDLTPSDDGLKTPAVESLTLKALPNPRRQRLISYPLLCFDSERDRFGNVIGARNSGYGWTRYRALEELEEAGGIIPVQDFTTGEAYTAVIESIRFNRRKPPDKNHPGFGGVATVILRRLA